MAAGLLVYDLVYLCFATVLYGGATFAGVRVFALIASCLPGYIAVFPAFVGALLALIAEVSLLSTLCPRLRPGRYEMMKGAVFAGWILRSILRRLLFVPGLRWLIFSSNVLRWLALRGMGARIAFASNVSADAEILDPSLLVVEAGATIGARCGLSGHYVDGGKLVLGEVRVGKGALLAAEVNLGPGCTVGPRASLLVRTMAILDVSIGEDARIGPEVYIDTRASIGRGARLGARTYVPSRAQVPDHARLEASSSASSTTSNAAPEV